VVVDSFPTVSRELKYLATILLLPQGIKRARRYATPMTHDGLV
jgi:hypothetical protein